MYQDLGSIKMKSGETLPAGVILGPDADWLERVVEFLSHKGDVWNWQNAEVLREDLGIEVRFYVAHRDGRLVSNILIAELAGAGILGHVFTRPKDRQQGSMRQLMTMQMNDFRARGGRALFLGTGFDSHPFHLYESFGFRGIEPQGGSMDFYADSKEAFAAYYFAKGAAEVQEPQWAHWPASPALFMSEAPGQIRCAPLGQFGRHSTEGSFVSLLRQEGQRRKEGRPSRTRVLQAKGSRAVVGVAAWRDHPLWPDTCVVDVYTHPNFWDRAPELLAALPLPDTGRLLAYGDAECPQKHEVLKAVGFRQVAAFPKRLAADVAGTAFVDAIEFEKP